MEMRGGVGAALLGTAAGMRVTVPLAAIGLGLPRGKWLGVPLVALSTAEFVNDALPRAGERTAPGQLAARLGAGALVGGLAARYARGAPALGALVGALAALGSTFLFHRLRVEVARRVPAGVAAVSEDALAIGLASGAVVRLRGRR